jgi:hypothetical protein
MLVRNGCNNDCFVVMAIIMCRSETSEIEGIDACLTLMFFQRLSVVSTIVLQIGPNMISFTDKPKPNHIY